jgi:hypothetical protein
MLIVLWLSLWVGSVHAEAMSAEGWDTLVRDARRNVAEQSPRALVAMRRLSGRQVRDSDGGVVVVDDRELTRLTAELERALSEEGSAPRAYRNAALYLDQLEGEVRELMDRPPPPYALAIRPDGTLFETATRPLQPARASSPLTEVLDAGWARVRAWVGIALAGRSGGGLALTLVLIGTSLAALLLALWPLLRSLGTGSAPAPVTTRARRSPGHSPLGLRLLSALDQLAHRGLLRRPAHLTNGEVLEALPDRERGWLTPAVRAHERCCYGRAQVGPEEHALLDALQRRLEGPR